MKDIEKEVVNVLTENPDQIQFEAIQSEQYSPLNQAVIEKDIADTKSSNNDWNIWKGGERKRSDHAEGEGVVSEGRPESFAPIPDTSPTDAPEQEIGSNGGNAADKNFNSDSASESQSESDFELPTATAKQAADTILGMANNVLAVGGGYVVKIKKHKEFYEYDEINELIDTQNEKNVNRIKLDKEDKALLKPPLVQVLKKKAKHLTPEQQLMGAALSIVLKKAQTVMEVRAENEALVERILDIVREEKGYSDQDLKDTASQEEILDAAYEEINGKPEHHPPAQHTVDDEDEPDSSLYDEQPIEMESVVEVADEQSEKQ
ncbi:MAG: hypothetical protein CL613_11250 [Aquimarina sp.]|nr:hypothetical protein [Aquimarina sp.]